jgi:nitrite reductase/ring-hydroxylating ferredoxin subunit
MSATNGVVVGRSDELVEGERLVVSVDDVEVGVFRVGGELYAWRNWCVHQGGPVCQGMIIPRVVERLGEHRQSLGEDYSPDELHIVCPWHGYEYNVRTGEHPGVPGVRLQGYPVYEREGEIVVEL